MDLPAVIQGALMVGEVRASHRVDPGRIEVEAARMPHAP